MILEDVFMKPFFGCLCVCVRVRVRVCVCARAQLVEAEQDSGQHIKRCVRHEDVQGQR